MLLSPLQKDLELTENILEKMLHHAISLCEHAGIDIFSEKTKELLVLRKISIIKLQEEWDTLHFSYHAYRSEFKKSRVLEEMKIFLQKLYTHLYQVSAYLPYKHVVSQFKLSSLSDLYTAFEMYIYQLKKVVKELREIPLATIVNQLEISLFQTYASILSKVYLFQKEWNSALKYFLYEKVEGIEYRKAHPADTYLSFSLNDGISVAKVGSEKRFIANDNNDRTYNTLQLIHPVFVNTTKVEKVNISHSSKREYNVKGKVISLVNEVDIFETTETNQIKIDTLNNNAYRKLSLGFGFYDSLLYLANGHRMLSIQLFFEEAEFSQLLDKVKHIKDYTHWIDESLPRIFDNAFIIFISTSEGLLKVNEYQMKVQEEKHSFEILIEFDKYFPSITSLDYEKDPKIIFQLNNESYAFAYSLLQDLNLKEYRVVQEVSQSKNLKCYNQQGVIDISAPFYPFGLKPCVGHQFIFGDKEMYAKKVEHCRLDISWSNLPNHDQGWKGYYHQYDKQNFDNSDYQVEIASLEKSNWKMINEEAHLFDGEQQLSTTSSMSIPLFNDSIPVELLSDEYNNLSADGFIKLTLKSPRTAFGHDIYPTVLSNHLQKKKWFWQKKSMEVIAPPIAPQVNNISLNYATTYSTYFHDYHQTGKVKFFHFEKGQEVFSSPSHLLPKVRDDYYFQVKVSNVSENQLVTLLFDLVIKDEFQSEEQLQWEYFMEGKWKIFDHKLLMMDETHQLSQTGVLMFSIPPHFSENAITIGMRVNKEKAKSIEIRGIHVNSMKVKISENSNVDRLMNLPKNGIKRCMDILQGVGKIEQPIEGNNGYKAINQEAYFSQAAFGLWSNGQCFSASDFHYQLKNILINKPIYALGEKEQVYLLSQEENILVKEEKEKALKEIEHQTTAFMKLKWGKSSKEKLKFNVNIILKKGYPLGVYRELMLQNLRDFQTENMTVFNCSVLKDFIQNQPYVERLELLEVYHLYISEGQHLMNKYEKDQMILPYHSWSKFTWDHDHSVVCTMEDEVSIFGIDEDYIINEN
ncbi:hypothetical protein [Flammeovirga pacifica]|uniref:Baseplate protein J-like domain-containing protein n=1 Tax=Flammeovirga pacifica TaxID=915059 RepID=A0A1S1YVA9_FLAPC|nr:hypothetical protein [Flammeovirga pacifica]OHX64964.1 hypothetical protein NH26_00675 [Flammeovirga pacifica]